MECVGVLEGHNGRVTSLSITKGPKGDLILASGGRDRSVILWDLDLSVINDNNDEANAEDRAKIKLGKPYKSLKGHSHFVSSVCISEDGKHLLSSSWDKTIRLWDLDTHKTKKLFAGHKKDVLSAIFSGTNKKQIVSGSMDNCINVWNAVGELKHSSTDSRGWVSYLKNIRIGKDEFLAAGSWDCKVRLYNDEYEMVRIFPLDYAVSSLSVANDGDFIFIGEKNGTIKVFKLGQKESKEESVSKSLNLLSELHDVAYDSKYFSVIAAATNRGLVIRDIESNKDVYDSKDVAKNQSCYCLAWDPSNTYLFAGFNDGAIRVFKFSQFDEQE